MRLFIALLLHSVVMSKEAMFYEVLENKKVACLLCPRGCIIYEGKLGFCRTRKNINSKLYTLVYNKPCTVTPGPIEKAPIYHFYPGHFRLTVATVGCNLKCQWCHNWTISQVGVDEAEYYNYSAEEIIKLTKIQGLDSISFTYTEPTVFFEYMLDILKLAKKEGFKTSIVSNGYINEAPLKELLKYLDAVKIDLKSFDDEFYKTWCSANLSPILESLKIVRKSGVWLEIVNLVIPAHNDDMDKIKQMCLWIKNELGADVPIHFTRFSPAYKFTSIPSTPVKTLEEAAKVAMDVGLQFVYIGNVPGHKYNSTYCPKCKKKLIHRIHFSVLENNIKNGKCGFCNYKISGIW